MNTFLKILYDEHQVIINAIDVVKQAKSLIGKEDTLYEDTIRGLLRFFRNYADRYHHYKEEMILFPEMNRKNEILQDGVIKEMFDNHEDFRVMLMSIEKNINEGKHEDAQHEIEEYAEALLDHIAVENEEIFQMASTLFSDQELEKISHRFLDCDRELGEQNKKELVVLANSLRKQVLFCE